MGHHVTCDKFFNSRCNFLPRFFRLPLLKLLIWLVWEVDCKRWLSSAPAQSSSKSKKKKQKNNICDQWKFSLIFASLVKLPLIPLIQNNLQNQKNRRGRFLPDYPGKALVYLFLNRLAMIKFWMNELYKMRTVTASCQHLPSTVKFSLIKR